MIKRLLLILLFLSPLLSQSWAQGQQEVAAASGQIDEDQCCDDPGCFSEGQKSQTEGTPEGVPVGGTEGDGVQGK